MRIMGLDVGEKRIGIAISDQMGWTAQGHSVLVRGKLQDDLKKVAGLCAVLPSVLFCVPYRFNPAG